MNTVLSVVLPVFGLIAVGWVAGRTRLLAEAGVTGLTTFVVHIAVPALLFRVIQTAAPLDAITLAVPLAYYGAAFLVMGAAAAFARAAFALSADEAVLFAMGCMFTNTTLLGVPLVYAAFGDAGVVPLMIVITFHSLVYVTLTMVVLDVARRGAVSWRGLARSLGHSMITNPVLIAIVAGVAWSASGLGLPDVADRMIGYLGDGAIPAALVALGASLAGFRLAGNLPQAAAATAIKLVVHPAVTFAVAHWVFDLAPLDVAVLTVTAALPAGLMVFLLARTYDVYLARAGSVVVLSTGLSVVTVSAVIAWFHAV